MQKRITHWLNQIGLDGIVIVLSSVVGIGLSIYSFIGGNQISQPLLVGVLSLLVLEAILQRVRFDNTKEEIINSLKGVRVETFTSGKDFADERYKLIMTADRFIYDTELCLLSHPSSLPSTTQADSPRKLLNERVVKGEINYKFVQAVYGRDHFESLLKKLFQFCKYNYYIGYFFGAPEAIPVLNIMIFDDKHFLLGGYYGPSARGDDRNLYIQNEAVGATLRQYFDYLWSKARLLNENRAINWDEIRYCGLKLGYTLDELNALVSRIAQEVAFLEIKVL
jgi:hypothetical protein